MKHEQGLTHFGLALALAFIPLMEGCQRPVPTGQILATVGGEDITRRDLQDDHAETGADERTLLETEVDRKLLARAARLNNAEDSPDYLSGLRRAREDLLIRAFAAQVAQSVPNFSRAAIEAYKIGHPWIFAERARLIVTPLVAETDRQTDVLSSSVRTIDSATLTPVEADRWHHDGTILQSGGNKFRIVNTEPKPLLGVEADRRAIEFMRGEIVRRRLEQIVVAGHEHGQVRYQAGFGPGGI